MSNYWETFAEQVPEILGMDIVLGEKQIADLTEALKGAHENYGTMHGYDAIPNFENLENKRLKKELKEEREKVLCKYCKGHGYVTEFYYNRSSTNQCDYCRGEGRHKL